MHLQVRRMVTVGCRKVALVAGLIPAHDLCCMPYSSLFEFPVCLMTRHQPINAKNTPPTHRASDIWSVCVCVDWQVRSAVTENHECGRRVCLLSWWLPASTAIWERNQHSLTAAECSLQLRTDKKFFRFQCCSFSCDKMGYIQNKTIFHWEKCVPLSAQPLQSPLMASDTQSKMFSMGDLREVQPIFDITVQNGLILRQITVLHLGII